MAEVKPFDIPNRAVWEAYQRVEANQGAAGVDDQSIEAFDQDVTNNLFKVWNRLSSGSCFPPPVKRVSIKKRGGGSRPLGLAATPRGDCSPMTAIRMVQGPEVVSLAYCERWSPMFENDLELQPYIGKGRYLKIRCIEVGAMV